MASLYWPYFVADYYRGIEIATAIVGIAILLSGLDDLFIDAWYWLRRVYRYFTVKRKYAPLTAEQVRSRPEQPLAIMVPAWQEYDVIAAMLENMVSTLEYKEYRIFVGTYRNDSKTIREVERMRVRYRHLSRVEVPHDGPTCKADCLNWVVQAIFADEKKTGNAYAGIILHDSEDVLHPLELKFYNYLLPRMDFIQLPVTSLERNWYEMVAGTYMDEFAESHAKDLVVRESMVSEVPSAGVGTCFSHRAMAELAVQTNNQPFNSDTLTEDYDIGARLGRMDMKQIFALFPVDYVVRRSSIFRPSQDRVKALSMPLGVREYFPNTFRTAYRQKARWLLGIGFQGWEQVGWKGSLLVKYLLYRDRKALFTSFVTMLAYVLFAHFIIFYLLLFFDIWTVYYPSIFSAHGWLVPLMVANAAVLLLRIAQRCYFVNAIYGWEHALLSVPRLIVGNFVNAMAAARAWRLYIVHLITGKRLAWDKTMHDFPSTDQLVAQRQLLGDLLVSWQAIDSKKLAHALTIQAEEGRRLGEILTEKGWLDPDTLHEAVRFQEAAVTA
ncbi:glycosyl transferase family protein [Castellaniella sp.]|uniref:glycosyl transferase family protein n=1 Tax=Castellaniella sp. TaxID=1955812 RepID=UPI002AFFE6B4|nr:glycosyl transferase family protein [Castellaniella sp.]